MWISLLIKENGIGFLSGCCSSKLLKFIVFLSNLGGVPVFNLPIENFRSLSLFASLIEGLSPTLPASCFSEPILINPCKKVPVVKTTDFENIFLLSPKTTPVTRFFETIKSSTEPSII